jgi:hypothetical protein
MREKNSSKKLNMVGIEDGIFEDKW